MPASPIGVQKRTAFRKDCAAVAARAELEKGAWPNDAEVVALVQGIHTGILKFDGLSHRAACQALCAVC